MVIVLTSIIKPRKHCLGNQTLLVPVDELRRLPPPSLHDKHRRLPRACIQPQHDLPHLRVRAHPAEERVPGAPADERVDRCGEVHVEVPARGEGGEVVVDHGGQGADRGAWQWKERTRWWTLVGVGGRWMLVRMSRATPRMGIGQFYAPGA